MKKVLVILMMAALATAAQAWTVAHWTFEDGVAGQPFAPAIGGTDQIGSVDILNGFEMRGWDEYYGPSFSSYTATGTGLSMRAADHHQDGYVTAIGIGNFLVDWAPSQFTIEATFQLSQESVDNEWWQTLIGRDGSGDNTGGLFSAFYFQKTYDNYFRVDMATADGERMEVGSWDTELLVQGDKWYSMAVTSDGSTLSLYVNDITAGAGFVLAGQTDISGLTNSAMDTTGGNWTFGRGWYGGSQRDQINGYIDDVRFSDIALSVDELFTIGLVHCIDPPQMDSNGDCKVDMADFAVFALEWMTCGYDIQSACSE